MWGYPHNISAFLLRTDDGPAKELSVAEKILLDVLDWDVHLTAEMMTEFVEKIKFY